ncbi:class F sortase [Streptomyces sp. P9(2023)]|uniref:class F sortase n=1 Tax=Streptomyces sp. P9(2023) TaxID=3064394 RepID=UPI0028F460D0|nr:class F sortase [Streptomyces sp. P9(2023)]MDT9693367.1 class F sortase [Streptomyces sp. P9(2023)]
MQGSNGPSRRGAWGVVIVVLLFGVHLVRGGTEQWPAGGPPQPLAAAAPDHAAAGAPVNVRDPLPASRPARIRVPAVRIDAPVTAVGLDAEGWIDTPPPYDTNLAGWFTGAVTPGEKGTAVVVGHVDTPDGRAVFYDLGALAKGHRVEIARKDGRTAVFAVYGIEVVPKEGFPAERIYRASPYPELRVITCGGGFSRQRGYDGNVVVSARLVEVR